MIRESGFKKAEDFYLALGSGKLTAGSIVNKVLQRLKVEQVAEEEAVTPRKKPRARDALASNTYGINVVGVEDVLVRLAKCCTPVPGDEIVGYISLGKGITVHRGDCPNVRALMRNPERFTPVEWDGGTSQSFRVQIAVDSWDRPRLLEDVARTFAEHGANIVSYGGVGRGSDGEELVRRAGRRREVAAGAADGAPERRRGLRRVPRHALASPSIECHSFAPRRGTPTGGYALRGPLLEPSRSLERGIGRGRRANP